MPGIFDLIGQIGNSAGGLFAGLAPQQQAPQPDGSMGLGMPQMQGGGGFLGLSPNTLLGLGAGIAGGKDWGSGISAGLQNAQAARAGDVKLDQQRAVMQSLIAKGMDPVQAQLAATNPEALKAALPSVFPKYDQFSNGQSYGNFNPATGQVAVTGAAPKFEKVGQGETGGYATPPVPGSTAPAMRGPAVASAPVAGPVGATGASPAAGAGQPGGFTPVMQGGPKLDDVAGMRKEIAALPEVKRFVEAKPVYESMVQSHTKDTAAADLDFVYGIGKIFDPNSVVREGEMKLVGSAQSIPEDIQGWMKRVVFGEGRLTPEARARILEVARIRMGEMQKTYQTRTGVYPDIAQRAGMRKEDVMPGIDASLPDAPAVNRNAPPPPAAPAKSGARPVTPLPAIAKQSKPVAVRSPEDARRLPPGVRFTIPDGREFVR